MTRSDIQTTLEATYPKELVDSLLTSYENALAEYKKGHWQYFGNEIGQFTEVARRVIEYQLDESCMSNGELNVLEFPRKATEEWAKFVDYNRTKIDAGRTHCYDIVVGPIANDGVAYLLGRYHEGTMTLRELAKDLQDKFLDMQYMFATERAIKCLMKTQIKEI